MAKNPDGVDALIRLLLENDPDAITATDQITRTDLVNRRPSGATPQNFFPHAVEVGGGNPEFYKRMGELLNNVTSEEELFEGLYQVLDELDLMGTWDASVANEGRHFMRPSVTDEEIVLDFIREQMGPQETFPEQRFSQQAPDALGIRERFPEQRSLAGRQAPNNFDELMNLVKSNLDDPRFTEAFDASSYGPQQLSQEAIDPRLYDVLMDQMYPPSSSLLQRGGRSLKGLAQAVNPVSIGKGMLQAFRSNPVGFLTSILAEELLLRGAGNPTIQEGVREGQEQSAERSRQRVGPRQSPTGG